MTKVNAVIVNEQTCGFEPSSHEGKRPFETMMNVAS